MDPHVNAGRLWDTLMESAEFGATANRGLHRLALTNADAQVRDWFVDKLQDQGCKVTVDDMGNIFGRRAGERDDQPPILLGSHLDSQPLGGRFDGVLGVLAGLEVIRALDDNNVRTDHPLEIVNWTNEEGARFAPAMLSSGVFGGAVSKEYAYARTDSDGVRFQDELERIGYRGESPCGEHPVAAYLELHIEQGPVLEAAGEDIGVVTGVQGMRWFDLTIQGFAGHAGTTPMHLRRDALIGAARIVEAVRDIAIECDERAVATTGLVRADPGSRNVIAGSAYLPIDLRHPDTGVLDRIESSIGARAASICEDLNLTYELERIWASTPVEFDEVCIDAVRNSAQLAGYRSRDMISGAGHDAVNVARIAPTAMIFVPCEGGISHNESENIQPWHAEAGAQTLLGSTLALDKILK